MAKRSSFGVGTLVAAAAGAVAGALGAFLSDKENRERVVKEAKHVERVVSADLRKARSAAKKTGRKVVSAVKRRSAKKLVKRRK